MILSKRTLKRRLKAVRAVLDNSFSYHKNCACDSCCVGPGHETFESYRFIKDIENAMADLPLTGPEAATHFLVNVDK